MSQDELKYSIKGDDDLAAGSTINVIKTFTADDVLSGSLSHFESSSNFTVEDDDEYLYRNLIFFSILLCVLLSLIIFCLVVTNWYHEVFSTRQHRLGIHTNLPELRRTRVKRALMLTKVELWPANNEHFPYNVSCVICLEDFEQGDKIRKLACVHVFHVKCVDTWILRIKPACPICKQGIVPQNASAKKQSNNVDHDVSDEDYETPISERSPSSAEIVITVQLDSLNESSSSLRGNQNNGCSGRIFSNIGKR